MSNYTVLSGSNCDGVESLSINVNGNNITVWGISEPSVDLENQLNLITSISNNIVDVIKHLRINGYEVSNV